MALWDFIQKRMEELGITQYDLETEYGIAYATLQRIKAGKPIKEGTKQKLALALKCSLGDINDVIYDFQNLKEDTSEKEEPSVMETVDKLEQMVKTEHPYLAAPAEKEEKPKRKATVRVIKNDPPPKEKWPEDPPEERKNSQPERNDYLDARIYAASQRWPDLFGLEKTRREAVMEYKQKLKDACLQALSTSPEIISSSETAFSRIGKRVLAELLKDDTGAE